MLKQARKQITQLMAMKSAYEIVKNPHRTDEILTLSEALAYLAQDEDVELFADGLFRDQKAVAAVESRYRLGPVDLSAFSKYPVGTLGRAYADHLKKNKILTETLKTPEVRDDFSYARAHIIETHDIWHAVTGFNTDVAGELSLAAFGAVQLSSQFEYLLLAGGLLNTVLYEFKQRGERMEALIKGWHMGKKAQPLFGVHWSELWSEKVGDIRREFEICLAPV